MRLRSEWYFDCEPRHIWPHFLKAEMDSARPWMFRFGMPKPVSCRLVENEIAVGGTRRCTTERGVSDQKILSFTDGRRLHYRMINSSMPMSHWIDTLEDTFSLEPVAPGLTLVVRQTTFKAKGWFGFLRGLAIMLFLKQTHIYAARNWRRLAYELAARDERGLSDEFAASAI